MTANTVLDALDLPIDSTPVPLAAEMYAQAGFSVVPLYGVVDGKCTCNEPTCEPRSAGKHPIGKAWQKHASSSIDEVRELFRGHRWNIGIMLGVSLVVLDIDGPTGFESLTKIATEVDVPTTLTSRSGSGEGEHRIFAYAQHHDPEQVTNRAIAPKLDVKTRTGQIVVAPSLHRAGNHYRWTVPMAPTVLPDDLYERIRKQRRAPVVQLPTRDGFVDRAKKYLDKIPSAISGSGGHIQTFAAARALVGFVQKGLPEADGWALFADYNRRCDPPWSEHELKHKWEDALQAHTVPVIEDRANIFVSDATQQVQTEQRTTAQSATVRQLRPESPDAWKSKLIWEPHNKTVRPAKHLENAVVVLRYHPAWAGRVRLDRHAGRVEVQDPPWHASDRSDTPATEWTDEDSARLSAWIKREVNLDMTIENCDRAVAIAAEANSFHPVRDYFDSLVWDQSPRLATAAATYLGAEQSPYTALVMRWWMTAAVARTYEPGCKVDNVLILEGEQDLKKSYALKVLASPKWFTDTPIDLHSKDAFLAMKGRLVIELAELESLRKVDANRAKTFFTSPVDLYRPPYGKRTVEVPRGCVFAGTVNPNGSYLVDPTGNRRYWPILCTRVDLDGLKRDRDALWAEAVHWYRAGAHWWPETVEEKALCAAAQAPRAETDEWEARIESHLASRSHPTPSVGEILVDVLDIHRRDWTRADQMRVAGILQRLGFEKYRETSSPRAWRYRVRTKASA